MPSFSDLALSPTAPPEAPRGPRASSPVAGAAILPSPPDEGSLAWLLALGLRREEIDQFTVSSDAAPADVAAVQQAWQQARAAYLSVAEPPAMPRESPFRPVSSRSSLGSVSPFSQDSLFGEDGWRSQDSRSLASVSRASSSPDLAWQLLRRGCSGELILQLCRDLYDRLKVGSEGHPVSPDQDERCKRALFYVLDLPLETLTAEALADNTDTVLRWGSTHAFGCGVAAMEDHLRSRCESVLGRQAARPGTEPMEAFARVAAAAEFQAYVGGCLARLHRMRPD